MRAGRVREHWGTKAKGVPTNITAHITNLITQCVVKTRALVLFTGAVSRHSLLNSVNIENRNDVEVGPFQQVCHPVMSFFVA